MRRPPGGKVALKSMTAGDQTSCDLSVTELQAARPARLNDSRDTLPAHQQSRRCSPSSDTWAPSRSRGAVAQRSLGSWLHPGWLCSPRQKQQQMPCMSAGRKSTGHSSRRGFGKRPCEPTGGKAGRQAGRQTGSREVVSKQGCAVPAEPRSIFSCQQLEQLSP